jgi:hypothetical protein
MWAYGSVIVSILHSTFGSASDVLYLVVGLDEIQWPIV